MQSKEVQKSKFSNNGTLSPQKRLNQARADAKRFYGLTLEEAIELRNGYCDICGVHAKKMVIDHIIPKTYRGVLCQQCNVRLGWFEKRKDIIVGYIAYSVKRKAKKR